MDGKCLRPALWLSLVVAAGCTRSSPGPTQPSESESKTADSELGSLVERYRQLPAGQKHTLDGDKLIIQIETLVRIASPEWQAQVEPIVRVHNEALLQRALNDPDLIEIVGTEFAPVPREK